MILDYLIQFTIENVLKQPTVLIFLLGYACGIITLTGYSYIIKKPEYAQQLNIIQQFFKITIFGYSADTTSDASPHKTRARTKSDAERVATNQKTNDTKSKNKMNEEIVNYFKTFLTILQKIKSIKELKGDIVSAEENVIKIQEKYFPNRIDYKLH